MKPRHKRIALALGALLVLAAAVALVLNAFRSNMVFFYTPTQIDAGEAPQGRTFRLGGMVVAGSVRREDLVVHFAVTDTVKTVAVRYQGILPDLFKEGKGVVAQGQMEGQQFVAREVLAKHDENYMPPEAAEALKKAGQYKGGSPAAAAPEKSK